MPKFDYLGFGLGLRSAHYNDIINNKPTDIDWFECITEDYLIPGGSPLYYLERVREHYPVVMHGVSLSIGSTDPLNMDYLSQVKALAKRIEPQWVSDHLCWTGVGGTNLHDLLPLPYTEEAIDHVVSRVNQVQDFLERRILLENVSSYVTYRDSIMSEWEFLTTIAERTDCFILLDVNNIYVSAFNHGFDPIEYLYGIPVERVQQFHMAGHDNCGTHIIDTHDHPIINDVWKLYEQAVERFGKVSTMIERDANMPPLAELRQELNQARARATSVLAKQSQEVN